MELRWLTAFVTVAEELNYRRAAEQLHVAQPAISQQIKNLEKDLGVRLFDRNNRSVQLTDAGDAFLAPCRSALRALENAGLSARNAGTGEFGKIRLGPIHLASNCGESLGHAPWNGSWNTSTATSLARSRWTALPSSRA